MIWCCSGSLKKLLSRKIAALILVIFAVLYTLSSSERQCKYAFYLYLAAPVNTDTEQHGKVRSTVAGYL